MGGVSTTASPTTPSKGISDASEGDPVGGTEEDKAGGTVGALVAADEASGLAADTTIVSGAVDPALAVGATFCGAVTLDSTGAGTADDGDDATVASAFDVGAVLGAFVDCANALDSSRPQISAANVGLASVPLENVEGRLL